MNILIFSAFYPIKDKDVRATKAVHYFAREWIKLGHRVIVIHNHLQLWKLYRTFLNSKKSELYIEEEKNYEIDGVSVLLMPIIRYIPRSNHILTKDVNRVKKSILSFLNEESFVPEKVIVHFCSSQWQIVESIRDCFPCDPIPVFHNCDIKLPNLAKKIVSQSPIVGVRSRTIENRIEKICDNDIKLFTVISGAPDYIYGMQKRTNEYDKVKTKRILYVGELIQQKNIHITIKALAKLKHSYDFIFNIIGTGSLENELKQLTCQLGMSEKVEFLGQRSREEVLKFMCNSDCFVMVSQPETFGLVYIEAMACGCFVIGSKNEGIDGIIRDKHNGFLVTPNDIDELAFALENYFSMDSTEISMIISTSIQTAEQLKESSVAKTYLDNIL